MHYMTQKGSLTAFLPFLIFVAFFLGTGLYYGDFYAFPAPLAALIGVISAFFLLKGALKEKIATFLEGCGDKNILTMCVIYILAGAFATLSKSIGSVDAIVALGTNYLSPHYYPAGMFLIASFLSIASGTSVGTIVALGPIAMGLAQTSGIDASIIGAALLGGAMFGDNLSIISDTTIAATQLLGCDMRDKFKNNILFVTPAALIALVIYLYVGFQDEIAATNVSTELHSIWLILPYLVVILLAFFGFNVFGVLLIGILLSGVIGFFVQDLSFLTFGQKVYEGFTSMTDIFLLSLFTGGLAHMVEKAGGLDALLKVIRKKITGPRSALLGMGTFVGVADLATANNTISIIIVGKLSKRIGEDFQIKPRVTASILDTFSCVVQGIIPYGAQVLILLSLSNGSIQYPNLLQHSYYLFLLLIAVLVYIFIGKVKE